MREFHDCSWNEAAEALTAVLPRLSVLRGMLDEAPMRELMRCADSLIAGDIRSAVDAFHSMRSELLFGGFRRVSGNLFHDFLLHCLLTTEHPFACMAAQNRIDEAVYNAMRADLSILRELKELDGSHLYRYIQDRHRELKQKNRPNKDSASVLASAAWGGGNVRPLPHEDHPIPTVPAFLPENAPSWSYGEEGLRDTFAADEALEEMYHRLLECDMDWATLIEDIWNFFAAYGTGVFLRSRMLVWQGGELLPMGELRSADTFPVTESEYRAFLNYAIAFMRGEGSEPLLLFGANGMGKTSMLISIAEELPEMRLVYVPYTELSRLPKLLSIIADQPLKFMLALDDADCDELNRLSSRMIPLNVMLVAVTDDITEGKQIPGAFINRIHVKVPTLEEFADMVERILDARGVRIQKNVIRNACVDYRVDSKTELTVSTAAALARMLSE